MFHTQIQFTAYTRTQLAKIAEQTKLIEKRERETQNLRGLDVRKKGLESPFPAASLIRRSHHQLGEKGRFSLAHTKVRALGFGAKMVWRLFADS